MNPPAPPQRRDGTVPAHYIQVVILNIHHNRHHTHHHHHRHNNNDKKDQHHHHIVFFRHKMPCLKVTWQCMYDIGSAR